ncbi:siderophore-interacting protein [Bradyrhizobium sp. STM 3562]|uniref:siderophore-interacting protein n=1 Tax=Bradyrhizobium sp. STM 3562 TaxID=578924 RepID=UPI00388ED70F
MKHATVAACETIAERFRLITLEGPALRACAWIPGHKVQIAMGSGFVARTYTPIEWDAATSRTRILAYVHGDGPGSAWVRGLKPGTGCYVFGPRRSLDVSGVTGPLAILGDETSIGLAHALLHQDRVRAAVCHFEVDDVEASRRVTAHLGLGHAALFGRTEDDAHVEEMETTLPALVAAGTTFVLTGKASTIQRLRLAMKRLAVPATHIVAKAYWAPGKRGLD